MSGQSWNDAERALLGALRSGATGPTPEQRRNLRERLARSIAAPASRPSAGAVRLSRSRPQRRLLSTALAALGNPIALAAAFSVGGATGAVVVASVQYAQAPATEMQTQVPGAPNRRHPAAPPSRRPPPPRLASSEVPSATPPLALALPDAGQNEGSPQPASSPVRRLAADPTAVASAASGAVTLAAQRDLLDGARAALGRGDYASALGAVEAHERRYPSSVLSEEREALAIKALAGTGRHGEAEARAARFRSRYPNSIMLPAIDEMLGTIR